MLKVARTDILGTVDLILVCWALTIKGSSLLYNLQRHKGHVFFWRSHWTMQFSWNMWLQLTKQTFWLTPKSSKQTGQTSCATRFKRAEVLLLILSDLMNISELVFLEEAAEELRVAMKNISWKEWILILDVNRNGKRNEYVLYWETHISDAKTLYLANKFCFNSGKLFFSQCAIDWVEIITYAIYQVYPN